MLGSTLFHPTYIYLIFAIAVKTILQGSLSHSSFSKSPVLSLTYPHIKKIEPQPARLQRIPRIRVAQIVMDYLAYGWSVEELCL